jgi:mannose-6-phosphate isomerase-like protein (cupin superfamily)
MGRKYEKLVFEFPSEYNDYSEILPVGDTRDFILSPQAYFRGATQIPGARFNVGFQIFVKPFFLDRIPHHHDEDEYLVFLGGTFPNLFDFDADIELTIGKEGVDAKVITITEPTIVRIPAGVHHCPINFTRVDKPIFFQAMLMQDMFSSIYDTEDGGHKELWYNGPVQCRLKPENKCDSCRNCIEQDWR